MTGVQTCEPPRFSRGGTKQAEIPKVVFNPAYRGGFQSLGRSLDKVGRVFRNDASLALDPICSEFVSYASVLVSYTQLAADSAAILKNKRVSLY